jgi:hypothetical protein
MSGQGATWHPYPILSSSTAAKAFEKLLDEGSAPPDLGRYMRLIAAGWMRLSL